MVFEREDLNGLSKRELKDIIVAQSKAIERLRKKAYAHAEFVPHRREMDADMDTAYYDPYKYGKMWWA